MFTKIIASSPQSGPRNLTAKSNMKPVFLLFFVIFYAAAQSTEVPPKLKSDAEDTSKTVVSAADSCKCVPYYVCSKNDTVPDNGDVLDLRIDDPCQNYLEVCCMQNDIVKELPTPSSTVKKHAGCGIRNTEGVGFRISGTMNGDAKFGEFPWMTAILRKELANSTNLLIYQCGGALIHPQVVLTAAHCVSNNERQYKIRVGEWDTTTRNEIFQHQDRDVKTVVIHPEFYAKTLFNNIALLILDTPVEIIDNVDVICLPKQDMQIEESKCFASGWGKDAFVKGAKYHEILKKLELPIIPRNTCQDLFRKTRLGTQFQLHASVICAGGNPGRDTCKGDGGSPLVCPIPGLKDSYFQAGIVSWGIDCGQEQNPGAYTNVAMFSNWIDEQLVKNNFNTTYYKY